MDKRIQNRQKLANIQKGISGSGNPKIDDWKYKWHFLMACYGWIPKDDFLDMEVEDVDDLIEINKQAMDKKSRSKKR